MDWRDQYVIGIAEIDNQHRELLRLFQSIAEAANEQTGWANIHFRIVELRNFAEFHFEFEESLMRMFGYANVKQHAESHRDFFPRLEAIMRSSIVDTVKHDVVKFLSEWLTDHIMGADRSYAHHILSGATIVRTTNA